MKKKVFLYGVVLALLTGCVHLDNYAFSLTLDGKEMSRIYYAAGKKKIGGAESGGHYRGPGVEDGYFDPGKLENGEYTIEHVGLTKIGTARIEVFGKPPKLPEPGPKCDRCDGTGLVECDACRSCPDCGGSRSAKCKECDGSGKVRNWYHAWVKTECGKCQGEGSLPCPRCAKCEHCDGTRRVKCPKCVQTIHVVSER